MTQDYTHPIAPPPEFIGEWWIAWDALDEADRPPLADFIAIKAAQWGSDQELGACCQWLDHEGWSGESRCLRAARRPKPPSLKEQALEALDRMDQFPTIEDMQVIRRALETLPE